MVKAIRIYIEGGGQDRTSWRKLRDGFGEFLDPLRQLARSLDIEWRVIPCGSRNETFKDFTLGLRDFPDAFNLLLIDSESRVTLPRWEHLRRLDRWVIPNLPEDRCQFMVQSMEAWLIADPDALVEYYGRGFRRSALPRRGDVEAIPKDQLLKSLGRATAGTAKRRYEKIRHCAVILGRLNADRVRQRARHCDLLFKTLEARIRE